jgi:hypothetical protein
MNKINKIAGLALSGLLFATVPVCAWPDTVQVQLPQLITTEAGSEWLVNNNGGTDTGRAFPPPDTVCDNSLGLTIENAFRANDGNISAYDKGWQVFINDQVFTALGQTVELTDNLTSQVITAKPEPLAGLDGLRVTVEHLFSEPLQAARIRVLFENTTNDPIELAVDVPVNLGSDADTTVEMTSSGDTLFKTDDWWVITSDGDPPQAPVSTIVLFGPVNPPLAPSAVTQNVFGCNDTGEGIGMSFTKTTIPANSIRSLMFFAGLGDIMGDGNTVDGAINNVAMFADPATIDASLVGDLSNAEWDETLNWRFIREGGVGIGGDGGGGGGSGCTLNTPRAIDPLFPLLLAGLVLQVFRNRNRRLRG